MSANNFILIGKKSFRVWGKDADTGRGELIGKGKNLETAVEIAENWHEKEQSESPSFQLEYGFWFSDD